MNARTPEASVLAAALADAALDAMFSRAWQELAPPAQLTIIEWAERFREMSPEETNLSGRYDMENTPALRGILAVCSDPNVRKVVAQKSAQIGYTAGVVCNVIGYHIHWRPSVQVCMFPRVQSGKDFAAEKFEPMVRASPVLAALVNLKSRAAGQGTMRRSYTAGLLKLVASNSPSEVKSTSGRVGIVEEPDDTNRDVGGQGNAIVLLGERTKTYAPDDLQLIGGTPTAKATSLIVKEMRETDQRRFEVRCHHCAETHSLDWSNVVIPGLKLTDEEVALPKDQLDARWPEREVYGRAKWEDTYYTCPHCGSVWSDDDRIANIRAAARVPPLYGWAPSASSPTPGFYFNELLSVFTGSRLPLLARKYLTALAEYDRGEPEKMVAFWNSTLGLPWEYRGELPEEDELRERALKYAEWTSPAGGLTVLLSIDVQHDRLACTVWVVGRGEEMWLAWWGELPGRTIVSHQGAWRELELLLTRTVRHASGATMPIGAVAIDSGDGQTSEAVYDFVRLHHKRQRPVLAVKGASDRIGRVEIWTRPKAIDPNRKATKASKFGVHVHQVGSAKAKDLILGWAQEGGRVRLSGTGPGRMHWFDGVRDDFYEQLLGEMKIPSRHNPRVREWTERTDRRNEVLDCTVYAVWLCRYLGLHLKKPGQWAAMESRLRQPSLLEPVDDEVSEVEEGEGTGAPPVPGTPQTSAPIAPRIVPPALPTHRATPHAASQIPPSVVGGGLGRISLSASARFGGRSR